MLYTHFLRAPSDTKHPSIGLAIVKVFTPTTKQNKLIIQNTKFNSIDYFALCFCHNCKICFKIIFPFFLFFTYIS